MSYVGFVIAGGAVGKIVGKAFKRLRKGLGKMRKPGVGGNGAASVLPDLSGASVKEVKQILKEAGFDGKTVSTGGYQKFSHPDGSKVFVNWDSGRITRSAALKYGLDGSRINKGQRLGPDGAEIPRNTPYDQHPIEKTSAQPLKSINNRLASMDYHLLSWKLRQWMTLNNPHLAVSIGCAEVFRML